MTNRQTYVDRQNGHELRTLNDVELEAVTGGSIMSSAFSNAVKAIGEGLSTMARNG